MSEGKRWAGLLRAVNVGGRTLKSAALKKSALDAGFTDVTTLLASGRVLVTGGAATLGGSSLSSVDLYDPAVNTWIGASALAAARPGHAKLGPPRRARPGPDDRARCLRAPDPPTR